MIDHEKLKYVIQHLIDLDSFTEARAVLDVLMKKAKTIEDYDAIGASASIALYNEVKLKCALITYTSSTTREQLFSARENLINCYNSMNYPEQALFYVELNLKIKPDDPQTLIYKASSYFLLGREKEAELILENISTDDKELQDKITNSLSSKFFREGKLSTAIINFTDFTKKKNNVFENNLQFKYWDGCIYPGRTLIIWGEGGIGDEIINIRFLNKLKSLGMNPILCSPLYNERRDLAELFKRHGYEIVTNSLFFDKDCLWTHMMSLPGYLGLKESQLWESPYLTPLRKEKNKLNDTNFKIGIKCNGNPYFEQDIYRSIPIEQILEIIPEGASIYYFDMEKEHEGTISLKNKIESWDDTLDYIDQMDIIVSSCTSLVHAAGAIGKRTIVLVPFTKYYVWTSSRNDNSTPWYGDNFTVIQQKVCRSWKEPLEEVKQILLEYK